MPLRTLLLRWLPLVLCMGLIFTGSSDLGAGAHTSRFFIPLLRWLLGTHFDPERAEFIHLLIRKTGHLSEYSLLCVLFWRALTTAKPFATPPRTLATTRRQFLCAIILSALYASSDEFHQSFVPSRTASPYDVMIDTVGATLGLCLYLTFPTLVRRYRRRSLKPLPPADRPVPDRS